MGQEQARIAGVADLYARIGRPQAAGGTAGTSAAGPSPTREGQAGVSAARVAYGKVSLDARVAAASSHMLVQLLYDRLAAQFRVAEAAAIRQATGERLAATERALAIVQGLESSLDRDRGGRVADALAEAYALMTDRLARGTAEALAQGGHAAMLLADAWRQISPEAKSRQSGALRP